MGSQQDLLTPCLCNLTKNGYHDLAKVVPRFWHFVLPHFNDILWKSLGIFGDVRKSLELLTHHLECQVFFVGSQQDLLIPCLCNLAKIWICVILVRWCQDLTLCTATFGILWKSLGIFGDVQKSLGLLQHHSECQVFFKQTQEIKRRKSHAFDI